jgi:hypothetical protein
MLGFPTPEGFVRAWQESPSMVEVSMRLVREGFKKMTPGRVRAWGRVFVEAGVKLKKVSG